MPAAGKTVRVNQTKDRSTKVKHYPTAVGDIDILAEGPSGLDETPCAEIHVLTAGDVVVELLDGSQVGPFPAPAGYVMPLSCRKILATGTTATNFLIYW